MPQRTFAPENAWLRGLLILPFAALVASGAALTVASLGSHGVANHVRYGEWIPPAGGLIMALPLLIAGWVYAWLVWRRTSLPFRIHAPRLVLAGGSLLAIAGLGVAYVVTIDNPSSYEGSYNASLDRFEPNLTVESFLGLSVALSVALVAFIYLAMRFLYMTGLERPGLAVPEGADPLGALLSEREARR